MGEQEQTVTFANETPLECTRRELRNANAALSRIYGALVQIGELPPDEHAFTILTETTKRICEAIRALSSRPDRNGSTIRSSVSTPGYGAGTVPTRACPDCDGRGTTADWFDPTSMVTFAGGVRSCPRCGGSGRVVAT